MVPRCISSANAYINGCLIFWAIDQLCELCELCGAIAQQYEFKAYPNLKT